MDRATTIHLHVVISYAYERPVAGATTRVAVGRSRRDNVPFCYGLRAALSKHQKSLKSKLFGNELYARCVKTIPEHVSDDATRNYYKNVHDRPPRDRSNPLVSTNFVLAHCPETFLAVPVRSSQRDLVRSDWHKKKRIVK